MKKHPTTEPNLSTTDDLTPFSARFTPSLFTTRPLSSLSNFKVLKNTQASTPFRSTPSSSPRKLPLLTLDSDTEPRTPEAISHESNNMSLEHVTPFHRDKEDENPENFLRSFFWCMGTANDNTKKQQFQYFLQADSVADEWFDDLLQNEKKDWATIETSFYKRWPRKKAVKKTTEEYEEEITGLHLKEEDLGKKEKVMGSNIYSHIAWADKITTIVKGVKLETTATYIGDVRKELPKLLREKVGVGHTSWEKFLQAVREVDMDHIRDGVNAWKKEQEEQEALRKRIQQLEKLTASPTAPLRQQMTTFSIGNLPLNPAQPPGQVPTNPFVGTTGGQGNLFQTTQTRSPAQNSVPRLVFEGPVQSSFWP